MQDLSVKEKTKNPFKKVILILNVFLLLAGFILGQWFETKDRNSVFVVDEARFLKLVSVGLALGDKSRDKAQLTDQDRRAIKKTMRNLSTYLNEYSKRPVLIQRKNNQGYELYRGVKQIDITEKLIIQLIGEEKWKAIGEEFLQG